MQRFSDIFHPNPADHASRRLALPMLYGAFGIFGIFAILAMVYIASASQVQQQSELRK